MASNRFIILSLQEHCGREIMKRAQRHQDTGKGISENGSK